MTNTTIPFSFIPGTKAKASEVNANFAAVSSTIDETKQYAVDEISALETKISKDISDCNDAMVKKDLSNTNLITNCILEAPNGIAEYSANIITAQEGLKVLIADGKNSDGTYKSIEYKLDADKTLTYSDTADTYLIMNSEGALSTTSTDKKFFFVGETGPTQYTVMWWYQPSKNIFKYSNDTGASWTKVNIIVLGEFKSTSGNLSSLKTNETLGILKNSDKNRILNWSMPDFSSKIRLYAVNFIAEYDLKIMGGINPNGVNVFGLNINVDGVDYYGTCSIRGTSSTGVNIDVPAGANVSFGFSGGDYILYKIPYKGVTYD